MVRLQKPRALEPGQTVGLVAPASALPAPEKLPVAISRLEAWGYRVRAAESCLSRHGYFAGPDALRAEDINRLFADDTVDAILCVRGGYGAMRILGKLDYDVIRQNPKVFSGFSDITALHSALREHTGLVTFHGTMAVSDFGDERIDPFSVESFFRVAGDPAPAGLIENPPGYPRETFVPGRAEGPLIGGNLSLIAACLGTPYAYHFDGAVLFLEEINEKVYAVDRMLTQLKNAGALDRVAGILLGEFTDCERVPPEENGFTLRQIFEEILGGLGKPVLSGLRLGHCFPRLTLPIGVSCRMDADAGTLEVLEGAVV